MLYGERDIELICADACNLPHHNAAFDAVLDKGTLDAIGITGGEVLVAAATELARVVRPSGVVVSVGRVLEPFELERAFPVGVWEQLRDGGLYLTEDGEATTDLSASLYAWRRL